MFQGMDESDAHLVQSGRGLARVKSMTRRAAV
jgi:hypothetical protein